MTCPPVICHIRCCWARRPASAVNRSPATTGITATPMWAKSAARSTSYGLTPQETSTTRYTAVQQVRRIGAGLGHEGEVPSLTGTHCASVHGFSLHTNTQVPAHRRDQLERLIHYTARDAVSLERLTQDVNGAYGRQTGDFFNDTRLKNQNSPLPKARPSRCEATGTVPGGGKC
jgi:hypothetical protein